MSSTSCTPTHAVRAEVRERRAGKQSRSAVVYYRVLLCCTVNTHSVAAAAAAAAAASRSRMQHVAVADEYLVLHALRPLANSDGRVRVAPGAPVAARVCRSHIIMEMRSCIKKSVVVIVSQSVAHPHETIMSMCMRALKQARKTAQHRLLDLDLYIRQSSIRNFGTALT
jgi:hypothetical protein